MQLEVEQPGGKAKYIEGWEVQVETTDKCTSQNITLPNTNIIGNVHAYKFHGKPVLEHCIQFDCFTEESAFPKPAEKIYTYSRCIFLG